MFESAILLSILFKPPALYQLTEKSAVLSSKVQSAPALFYLTTLSYYKAGNFSTVSEQEFPYFLRLIRTET